MTDENFQRDTPPAHDTQQTTPALEAPTHPFADALATHLKRGFLTDLERAHPRERYTALARAVRDAVVDSWLETQRRTGDSRAKVACYLSLEFLLGRLLRHNLDGLQLTETVRGVLADHGVDLDDVLETEREPGLGNGGLGRLAACFAEAAATLGVPMVGYGIRYEFGIFQQAVRNGWQVEHGDPWLRHGNPWEVVRDAEATRVRFNGREEHSTDAEGRFCVRWVDTDSVWAVPYDMPVVGYGAETVNTLRLWGARAVHPFDFALFNAGEYERAVEAKVSVESITKVLYPNDETEEGKMLRLKQQYFFVSASIQDVIRRTKRVFGTLDALPQSAAIQLNDTHPSIAIAELMHQLIDVEDIEWDRAWKLTTKVFSYTNHTLLPEALETWPVDMLRRLLPRHLSIIYEINRRFVRELHVDNPQDTERQARMSLIDESDPGGPRVRMAHLATIGSQKVNGVSQMHTELLTHRVMDDFAKHTPDKFVNVTNGVNHRRWLYAVNPALSEVITERIGDDWLRDATRLGALKAHADDGVLLEALESTKRRNKEACARWLKHATGIVIDPSFVFDVHIKRIHEYKRQLLNALHIVSLYRKLKEEGSLQGPPRAFIFGGKAAPGYATAKLIIKLINDVAEIVNNDPCAQPYLRVVFVPDYRVTVAAHLIPAADVSEQISTAGFEASGTGNMKFALNGALTIGTLDGANVEIRNLVGDPHFFHFGLEASQIAAMRDGSYAPERAIGESPALASAIDAVESGWFSPEQPGRFAELMQQLRTVDRFFLCADFEAYRHTHEQLGAHYLDRGAWRQSMLQNIAGGAAFSADASIKRYAEVIWGVEAWSASR